MCYDLIVLVLSIVNLSRQSSKSPLKDRLRAQGLLYFAIATMANILPIVCTARVPFTTYTHHCYLQVFFSLGPNGMIALFS